MFTNLSSRETKDPVLIYIHLRHQNFTFDIIFKWPYTDIYPFSVTEIHMIEKIVQTETRFLLLDHTAFRAQCINTYLVNKPIIIFWITQLYCIFCKSVNLLMQTFKNLLQFFVTLFSRIFIINETSKE